MTINILDKHIEVNPTIVGGKPHIKDRRITVQNIAVWHERLGKNVDDICEEYDLTLGDVYAALAYYFDNRETIDRSIAEDDEFVKQLQKQAPSLLQTRLQKYAA